ncbi:MAG: flagellar hook assembly protein FlgD [Gammaproteobacteria bacterium]
MNTIDNKVLENLNLSRPQEQQGAKDKLGQEGFLELMTAQLNNQDPLKPMQSGEFFTQIAQFSSVSGMQELQNSFQQVASAMFSSQVLQASAMIGRSVLVPGEEARLASGSSVEGLVELPASSADLRVGVFDSNGQLVRNMDLGQQPGGDIAFSWDGRVDDGAALPAGNYYLKAAALYDGKSVALETFVAAQVESVAVGGNGQGVTLNLAGQGGIDLSNVKRVM